jgi:hypothetical protein
MNRHGVTEAGETERGRDRKRKSLLHFHCLYASPVSVTPWRKEE